MRLTAACALLSVFLLGCDTTAEPAPAESVPASKATTEATGITAWEVKQDGVKYDVIGRGQTGDVRANFTSTYNPAICRDGSVSGTPVTITANDKAGGVKTLDCKSDIVTNTMDSLTQGVVDHLSTDLHGRLGGNGENAKPIHHCPPWLCGCPQHTQTKCFGVSLWCKDFRHDCSSSYWYPCGGCIGKPW